MFKFDHENIGKTAVYYNEKTYEHISESDIKNIRIRDFNKRVFMAIIREIYLTFHKRTIAEANNFAKSVLHGYIINDVTPFMQTFINDESFRTIFNKHIYYRDVDSVSDAFKLYADHTLERYKHTCFSEEYTEIAAIDTKRASIGLVLKSLLPVLLRIHESHILLMQKSTYGKLYHSVMRDSGVQIRNSRVKVDNCDGILRVNTAIEMMLCKLVILRSVDIDLFRSFMSRVRGLKPENIKDFFFLINALYNDLFTCNRDLGLQ